MKVVQKFNECESVMDGFGQTNLPMRIDIPYLSPAYKLMSKGYVLFVIYTLPK